MGKLARKDRNWHIRTIHAAARNAGLGKDDRKRLQLRLTGEESCADMSLTQLETVSRHIANLKKKPAQHKAAEHAHHRKIYAIWWDLGKSGALGKGWNLLNRDARVKMLNGFVRKQTGVDHVEWTTTTQANSVIQALQGRVKRAKKGKVL